jgi:hypothetical protein
MLTGSCFVFENFAAHDKDGGSVYMVEEGMVKNFRDFWHFFAPTGQMGW